VARGATARIARLQSDILIVPDAGRPVWQDHAPLLFVDIASGRPLGDIDIAAG
jgi:hypothetical protein